MIFVVVVLTTKLHFCDCLRNMLGIMIFKRHGLTFKTGVEREGKVDEGLDAVAMLSDLSHYFFQMRHV